MKKIILTIFAAVLILLAAYEALMYYDNNFIYGRMRETPAVRPYEQPMLIMQAGIVPFGGGEQDYIVTAADELRSPLQNADPEMLKLGNSVYSIYCAQCHGKNYDGNGTVGQSFQPLPTDLRSEKVQSKSDGALFKEISYGIPGGRQPALATTIDVMDRWRVVGYVKSLGVRE